LDFLCKELTTNLKKGANSLVRYDEVGQWFPNFFKRDSNVSLMKI